MKVLQVRDLAVGYGTRTVVDDINLDALRGQIICLLGPNGSGEVYHLALPGGAFGPFEGLGISKGKPALYFGVWGLGQNHGRGPHGTPFPGAAHGL